MGVNAHADEASEPIETLVIDEQVGQRQAARLEELRTSRDARAVEASLASVGRAAAGGTNLMPAILDAVRAYATLGEICDVLRAEFGVYAEQPAL